MENGKKQDKHIISILVEDKVGALQRIASVFSKRGFNMDSITVGRTETEGLSRMTIVTNGTEGKIEQMIKQLHKVIDIIKVSELSQEDCVVREIALFKVHVKDINVRSELMNYINIFRGRVVDVSSTSMMVEITGTPDKVDAFADLIKPFGVKEFVRTGITALSRSGKEKAAAPETHAGGSRIGENVKVDWG
ncbi:acetolactate synthase small subunit [Candidatus Micrarchaeota archaeon]|nr:acetolactate synthase small subunit [Candidatus Micrarchaeota archaeon]